MLDVLINALKISISECRKYDEPAEYIYQVNQVLNRYKTNLFKMLKTGKHEHYDPKEIIQIKIHTCWILSRGFNNNTNIVERPPIMLQISGFSPADVKLNREKTFVKSVDINDVFDFDKINKLRTDHFIKDEDDETSRTEMDIMADYYGYDNKNINLYYRAERIVGGSLTANFQINGIVYSNAWKENETCIASSMNGSTGNKNGEPKQTPPVTDLTEVQIDTSKPLMIIVDGNRMSKSFSEKLMAVKNGHIATKSKVGPPEIPRGTRERTYS